MAKINYSKHRTENLKAMIEACIKTKKLYQLAKKRKISYLYLREKYHTLPFCPVCSLQFNCSDCVWSLMTGRYCLASHEYNDYKESTTKQHIPIARLNLWIRRLRAEVKRREANNMNCLGDHVCISCYTDNGDCEGDGCLFERSKE